MPTLHDTLTADLIAVLDACTLGRDAKVKAIGAARLHVDKAERDPEDWRAARARQGVVGTGKKSDALRDEMKKQPSRRNK